MAEDLGKRAVRGVAWLGMGQMVRQVLAFGTNVALARMLFPDDFGLFGMAYVAAEIAQAFSDFGLGAAIVQQRETDRTALTTCFWVNLAVGIVVGLVLVAIGPLLAAYFSRREIPLLVLPLAGNMVISAGMVVPKAILTQQLRFKDITVAQTVGSIAAAILAISLAYAGSGVWALVAQPVAGNLVSAGLLYGLAGWYPAGRPQLASIRGMIRFSSNLLGTSLISVIGRNLHAFILGRRLGGAPLGIYNMASSMTGTILFQVSSVVVRVLFPAMASLRDDPVRLRTAWLKAASGIAVLGFPAMAGMIAVAPDLVPVVFGPQWAGAIDVLRVLSFSMAVQCVLTTAGTVLLATGRADINLRVAMVTTPALAMALWFGASFGILGAAIGYSVVNILANLVVTRLACKECGISLVGFFLELLPWVSAAATMTVGVLGIAALLAGYDAKVRLAVCIAAGVALYAGLALIIMRNQRNNALTDIWRHLKRS